MLPSKHIIFGFMFSSLLLFIFPEIKVLGFTIIFLSSFLIDVDHYIYYIMAKKDLSLKKAHKWFSENYKKALSLPIAERKKINPGFLLFHGIEATVLLVVLSFYNNLFLLVLIGFLFHQFLDLLTLVYFHFPLYKLGSQTYNFLKFDFRK